jgi:hypothetical protein
MPLLDLEGNERPVNRGIPGVECHYESGLEWNGGGGQVDGRCHLEHAGKSG